MGVGEGRVWLNELGLGGNLERSKICQYIVFSRIFECTPLLLFLLLLLLLYVFEIS